MNMKRHVFESLRWRTGLYVYLLCGLITGGLIGATAVFSADQSSAVVSDTAMTMEKLQKDGKYVCLLLYKEKNAKVSSVQKAVEVLKKNKAGKVELVMADVLASTSESLLQKYRMAPERMPMPLLIVFAPNDVVTGVFETDPDEKKLSDSILSQQATQCLKLLQDGKNVVLCIQGESTKGKEQVVEAVNTFLADGAYKDTFDKVFIDPGNAENKAFLEKLNVTMTADEAVTVVLTSQGRIAGTFKGVTSKDQLVKSLQACGSSCGSKGLG
ncbi:MAG: hypothetical protein PHR77_09620 [Kiritimatiellae bacterium]|nr:hypothetical protein [Kiritimatiellia bacterium]MDD5520196.1 hypothetical protein [Kiritimatiellia bacterium]